MNDTLCAVRQTSQVPLLVLQCNTESPSSIFRRRKDGRKQFGAADGEGVGRGNIDVKSLTLLQRHLKSVEPTLRPIKPPFSVAPVLQLRGASQ